MLCRKLPSGITITQAKKDAKKLAEAQSILLSKAQDLIAFQHGRAKWPVLMQQINQQAKISFNNGDNLIFLPPEKYQNTFTLLTGEPGAGKSVLLAEIAAQLVLAGQKVTYLSYRFPSEKTYMPVDYAERCFVKLSVDYPDLFNIYSSALEDLELNGAVLLIDDMDVIQRRYSTEAIIDLLRCSMHSLISCQCFDDLHKSIQEWQPSDGIVQVVHLEQSARRNLKSLVASSRTEISKIIGAPKSFEDTFEAINSIIDDPASRTLKFLTDKFSEFGFSLANSSINKIITS